MSSSGYLGALVVSVTFAISIATLIYVNFFENPPNSESLIYLGQDTVKLKENVLLVKTSGEHEESGIRNEDAQEKKSVIDCANMVPKELQVPQFLGIIPNTTHKAGNKATMNCVVENIRSFKLVWFNISKHEILAVQDFVITRNSRIKVALQSQNFETHCNNKTISNTITTYSITINNLTKYDTGFYMCQINTEPMKAQWGHLEVSEDD